VAGSGVGLERGEKIEACAESKLGDMEAVAEAVGQAVSGQKDMAGFGKASGEREIGVVEGKGDGDDAVAPVERGCLGLDG
jgi:hypothetical protein